MDKSSPDNAKRIDELEARIALQDQSMSELGDEVYQQQQQITALEIQIRDLNDRLQSLSASPPADESVDDVPPHY